MLSLLISVWSRSCRRLQGDDSREEPLLSSRSANNLKTFSLKKLEKATTKFCADNLIGKDDLGENYLGLIEGKAVSVKKLSQETGSDHEWLMQIKYLGTINHPNLVRVLGYCIEKKKRLVVSDLMLRGSLGDNLFRGDLRVTLTWNSRMRIAFGAAKGLAYLHDISLPRVFHWNLTIFNILLDSNYHAKLSDFGYVRNLLTFHPCVTGYVAPEFPRVGVHTSESEVYSFGVILFEILFGRRAVDISEPFGRRHIVQWAYWLNSGTRLLGEGQLNDWISNLEHGSRVLDKLDIHYLRQYPRREAIIVFITSLACTSEDPSARPTMNAVVAALGQLQANKD